MRGSCGKLEFLHRRLSDLQKAKCVGFKNMWRGRLVTVLRKKLFFECHFCRVSAQYSFHFHINFRKNSFAFSFSPSLLKTTLVVLWHLSVYDNGFRKITTDFCVPPNVHCVTSYFFLKRINMPDFCLNYLILIWEYKLFPRNLCGMLEKLIVRL